MLSHYSFQSIAWAAAILIVGTQASAQDYPSKPVRIVVGEPGGGTDFMGRVIAQGLSTSLGLQAITENRGAGSVPLEYVFRAPADGYTLLYHGPSLWMLPFLRTNVPWDPIQDFAPVTAAASAPNIVVVSPSLPANSIRELILLARAKPGELNYGSGGSGSTLHLAAELFKAMAGVNILRIPYKGTGPAFIDLMANRVQVMFPSATSAAPNIKSGKVRALAVGSIEPSELAPGVPTVASSGLPGYESVSIFGVFAPAKTPDTIIRRLNQDIVRLLKTAEAKERFFNAGTEANGSSPEQLTAIMKSEMARLGKVIRDAGIRE